MTVGAPSKCGNESKRTSAKRSLSPPFNWRTIGLVDIASDIAKPRRQRSHSSRTVGQLPGGSPSRTEKGPPDLLTVRKSRPIFRRKNDFQNPFLLLFLHSPGFGDGSANLAAVTAAGGGANLRNTHHLPPSAPIWPSSSACVRRISRLAAAFP